MQLDRAGYFLAGSVSSYPNVESSDVPLCVKRADARGCRVFRVARTSLGAVHEIDVDDDPDDTKTEGLRDQVLVFKYKGKIYAVDEQCPHASYPLSNGTVFDIEDFGLALSAGVTCAKHMWSFDLTTGLADRGNYKLKVWEAQLRSSVGAPEQTIEGQEEDKEVWVRRRPRIGYCALS